MGWHVLLQQNDGGAFVGVGALVVIVGLAVVALAVQVAIVRWILRINTMVQNQEAIIEELRQIRAALPRSEGRVLPLLLVLLVLIGLFVWAMLAAGEPAGALRDLPHLHASVANEPREPLDRRATIKDRVARDNRVPDNWPQTAAEMQERFGQETPPPAAPAPPTEAELDQAVREMIATRAIHSIDLAAGTVRIDPAVWLVGDVTGKQQIVLFFHQYLRAKGRPGYPKILSDRNDTVLAEYSAWSGIKIHH